MQDLRNLWRSEPCLMKEATISGSGDTGSIAVLIREEEMEDLKEAILISKGFCGCSSQLAITGGIPIDFPTILHKLNNDDRLLADEDLASAWVRRGEENLKNGIYKKAAWCFENAIEREPENSLAWMGKSRTLKQLGRDEEALACYDRAIKMGPHKFDGWLGKGFCLIDLDQQEEASWCFETALEINPKDSTAWLMKGLCMKALGRPEDALEALEHSLDLDPQRGTTWAVTGEVMELIDRPEEARVCRETAKKLGV